VSLRFGLVLAAAAACSRRCCRCFRLGLGGPIGPPERWWSWVAIEDVVGMALHAAATPELDGPLNVVSPEPVTVGTFTTALGRALHRPAVLPVPAWGLRVLLGEMADAMVLTSLRVVPRRAVETAYPVPPSRARRRAARGARSRVGSARRRAQTRPRRFDAARARA
jgi:NAD dependent epimerase/dehydratase family enzyme